MTISPRPIVRSARDAVCATLLVLATACGGDSTSPAVVRAPVSTVVFTEEPSQFMVKGGTQQLAAQARDASGATLSGRTIAWSSSNASVASVSTTGLVTALAHGVTTVRAESEGRSITFILHVSEAVAEVTIASADDIFELGTSHQLTVRARDGNGATINNPSYSWSFQPPGIATITRSGMLTIASTSNDSVVVTATLGGKTARFRFFAWPRVNNDVPVMVNGATEQSRWFLMRSTPGTTRLTVTLSGGTGDADLFVWTPGTWAGATQMCESISPTNTESCTIDNPQSGLWSIEVYGYSAFDNLQLRAVRTGS